MLAAVTNEYSHASSVAGVSVGGGGGAKKATTSATRKRVRNEKTKEKVETEAPPATNHGPTIIEDHTAAPILATSASDAEVVVREDKKSPANVSKDADHLCLSWAMLSAYYRENYLSRLVRHQLESYNHFVEYQIFRTIEMFNPLRVVSKQDYDERVGKHCLEVFIHFDNFRMYRPQINENNGATKLMFPKEARLRNFTYASAMTVDLNIQYITHSGPDLEQTTTFHRTLPGINIGKLPVMVRSALCLLTQYAHRDTGECTHDTGGYFIIKGSEKVVIGQERAAENRVYVYNVSKNMPKYTWSAEVRSVPDFKCISPKQTYMYMSAPTVDGREPDITVMISRVRKPVPLFTLFRALGVISDRAICEYILLSVEDKDVGDLLDALRGSILKSEHITTQEEAIHNIMAHVSFTPYNTTKEEGVKKKNKFTLDVLTNDLFPHCTTATQKLYFLGYMSAKLLLAHVGRIPQDDRDSLLNKRVDTTGVLLNNLFRNYFNKMVKYMEKAVCAEIEHGNWRTTNTFEDIINYVNVYKIVRTSTIENGIQRALSTGDFGISHSNTNKVGVGQILNRLNYLAFLSHLRRISTPTDKSGKLIPPRKLHNTSWGFICPAETPEGQSVGIVKNLSVMTHITVGSHSQALYEYVAPWIDALDNVAEVPSPTAAWRRVKVFINGCWVGLAKDPVALYRHFRQMKATGVLNIYTAVVFDYRLAEIRVYNDSGRLLRPLYRATPEVFGYLREHGADVLRQLSAGTLGWDDLFLNVRLPMALLEYVDAEEQSWSLIANVPREITPNRHTHCEIHPSTIFGVLASCIPYPEHNQSPRNTYQCAQGKQAMGIYATNYADRMDKTGHVLEYPMRPLVDTRWMDMFHLNEIPCGTQMIVAIMTHTGYNQEDSLLVNKGAIDRGLALTTVYHTEKDEEKQNANGDEEICCRPDETKTKQMKMRTNYEKLGANGLVPVNTRIENRDVIIGKVAPIKENRNNSLATHKYTDHSRVFKTSEETYVDRNLTGRNGDGYMFIKVRTRTLRKPVIGDKFSSRHGQKGTVGNIIPECDMPFTANGVRPDIIINPHAIPSRMTIGQLKETLLGKVLVELGLFGDGTPFVGDDVADISRELLRVGFEAHGNELLYNGLTGEQHECSVFMGPVYYQRLKHMVSDKIHSRSNGPTVNITRQPAEGRSRDGGHRFGEMERDCMISHGTARFVRDRMYFSSDKYAVHICNDCGMIAVYNDNPPVIEYDNEEIQFPEVYMCRMCDNRSNFSYVELPYACKLLFQELNVMNIAPRILTDMMALNGPTKETK